jgi:hypothetical protein
LQKSAKKVQEAMTLVSEESAKSKAAKEVIKSLTAQVILTGLVILSVPSYTAAFLSDSLRITITRLPRYFLDANLLVVV